MVKSESTFSYYGIMERFVLPTQFQYIACAVVIIFMNLVICQFFTMKFFRRKTRGNTGNIMLFNLALSDVCYEAITTPLLFVSDYCESPSLESCKSLYVVYLAFNISTVLHIVIEITDKMFATCSAENHRYIFSPTLNFMYSIGVWFISFLLAFTCSRKGVGFLQEDAMVLLGRFKTYGYFLFLIISMSIALVILSSFCYTKLHSRRALKKDAAALMSQAATGPKPRPLILRCEQPDELIFCCLFLSFFVSWFGWLVLVADTSVLKSIEVMKSFEVTRLGARVLNLLTLLYAYWEK